MLNDLKKAIKTQEHSEFIVEEASKRYMHDDIRDIFLDDIDTMLDGAENDPGVAKMVSMIPVCDENEVTDADLKKLVESVVTEDWIKKSGASGNYGPLTKLMSFGIEPVNKFINTVISDPLYKLIQGDISKMTDVNELKKMHEYAEHNAKQFRMSARSSKILPPNRVSFDVASEWWDSKAKKIESRLAALKK